MYAVDAAELIVAHGLHPQFRSTRFAKALPVRGHVAVQHHHAHIASVLAEHQKFDERVVGVAFDGTGYGTDGSIWGGEFFVGSIATGFEHSAALRPVQMPGGDAAARFPVQAAAGFLANVDDLPDLTLAPFAFPKRFVESIELVNKDVRCLRSTSAGRLFDAIAALLGFTQKVSFEGQAAIWLENQARQGDCHRPYPFPGLDHRHLLRAVIADRLDGVAIADIALSFHSAFACEIARTIIELSTKHDIWTAALSGGVFQNELLGELIHEEINHDGHVELLTNQKVPVNDGGICLGQAALAWAHDQPNPKRAE